MGGLVKGNGNRREGDANVIMIMLCYVVSRCGYYDIVQIPVFKVKIIVCRSLWLSSTETG